MKVRLILTRITIFLVSLILVLISIPMADCGVKDKGKKDQRTSENSIGEVNSKISAMQNELLALKAQDRTLHEKVAADVESIRSQLFLLAQKKPELIPLWITALGSLLISIIALFKEDYKNWRYRPILYADFKKTTPWILNILLARNGISNPIRHYRLKIINNGRKASEETEARIEKVVTNNNQTIWYHPTLLKWSGEQEYGTVRIPTKSHFFLDAFHINIGQNTWELWVENPGLRGLPPAYPTQGDYEIHLFITEKTTKPTKCLIKISWTGQSYLRPDVRIKWEDRWLESSEYVGFDDSDSEIGTTTSQASTTSGPTNSQTTHTTP